MIHAADYRRRAEDCATRARDAQDEFHRRNFLELATMWAEMADKTEGRAPLVDRLSQEEAAARAERAKRAAERRVASEQKMIDDAVHTIKTIGTN